MIEKKNNDKKKKLTLKKVLKKVRLSHLLVLVLLLSVNSYAWFVYINTVSNSLDVHVKSWKIDFTDGGNPVTDYVNVFVDNVYPGMTTYEKPIEAHNYSDIQANVTFSIIEASVMNDTWVTVEGRNDRGETAQPDDMTSAQLMNKLANDYPFKITFTVSSSTIEAENGVATYTVRIAWPYESGDNELDTYWGNQAYEFRQENPDTACIRMIVKIYITQANS